MTQLSYLTPTAVPVSDRRTRILVMGIILLLAGALCVLVLGLMSYFLLLVRRRPISGPSFPINHLLMPLLLYAVAGAILLWLGMGAILRRRWVRPVVLAIAWPWLMVGTVGVVIAIIAIVHVQAILAGSSRTAAYSPFMFMGVFVVSGVYFFFPLSLILVFQSRDVQATLEFYDPRPRWTDDKPVPVLCLCVYLLLTAVTFAMNSRGVFPFFGGLITGAQGVV